MSTIGTLGEVLAFVKKHKCPEEGIFETVNAAATRTIEEVFPDMSPAKVLRGFRGRDEMTQLELADRLGIAQTRVSEMESGKRPISVKMAKQLAEIFETSYKVFL